MFNGFGNLNAGDLNTALGKTGSSYRVPTSGGGKGGGGGMLGGIMGGLGGMLGGGGGGQQQQAPQRSANPYQSQARDIGGENQQDAFNKVGAVIGAIGNFYSGNYIGMANNIKGLSG